MTPSQSEMLRAAALATVGLLLGAITGAYAVSLMAMSAIWVARHIGEFRRFNSWSRHPLSRPDAHHELWQIPTDHLFRTVRGYRQRSRKLVGQLRRFRLATEALPDGAVLMASNGTVEVFNESAKSLLGLAVNDPGQNLGHLLRHPDLTALVNGEVEDDLIEIASPLDDSRRLEVRRIDVDEGQVLILARDVTELNRLLTMRQDFIANVSHELRTPLTVIMGYLETLQDESFDTDEMREVLAKLDRPAERMRALVDDLLLLTRLESSPPLAIDQADPVDIPALVRQIATEAAQLSQTDGRGDHQFDVAVDEDLRLHGVETELHSAFANLINNAVRYSPEGGTVSIRWSRCGGRARLEVCDPGLGIAPEHLSRLTERFYRIDLAGSRVRGGTGLGLAIVKHVLKRHGSELEVESTLGEGSRFHCVFQSEFVDDSQNLEAVDTKQFYEDSE